MPSVELAISAPAAMAERSDPPSGRYVVEVLFGKLLQEGARRRAV